MKEALYIYNIFPRVYQDTKEWYNCVDRAQAMGFNTIYVNAFFKTGASKSIYSIVDYYEYDELSFQENCEPEVEIKKFNEYCHQKGMKVLVDLVINHMAPETSFITRYPKWFKFDKKGNVKRDGTRADNGYVIWHDTAKLNYSSRCSSILRNYMLNLCEHYLNLGFDGFRCDVANHVKTRVWKCLIDHVRSKCPKAIFIGEAFMCPVDKSIELGKAGFDYVFNSSKWWDYNEKWLIEQHNASRGYVDTISFTDNHDTERLMEAVNDDIMLFKQRIFFSALFSKGFYITDGLEFGLRNRLSVFNTTAKDRESSNKNYQNVIKEAIELKEKYKALRNESFIEELHNDKRYFCLKYTYEQEAVLLFLNKTKSKVRVNLRKDKIVKRGMRINKKLKFGIVLEPMEVNVYELTKGKLRFI